MSNSTGRRKSLLQPFVTVGVGYERFNDIKESEEVGFVYVIQMYGVAFHGSLVTKCVFLVIAIFTTGTEGGDKVLWYVNPKAARSSEVLLA